MKTTPILKYWAIALVGIVVSFILFFMINDKKIQKNTIVVENAISKAELKLTDELQKIHLVMASMSFFFESTPEISQEKFQRFTEPFKKDLNGIKALEWAPKLLESEKQKFVSATSEDVSYIKKANASYDLVQSETKALYYPIALINPKEHKWILGYDLYSEENRKNAIKESTHSKEMTFTAPINLVNDDNLPAFLAIKTVFEPNGIDEKGVVAVVYRMDQFLKNTLSNEMDILDLTIHDNQAKSDVLFSSIGNNSNLKNRKIRQQRTLNAAKRTWSIAFYPKEEFTQFPYTSESFFVLFLGFLTTYLILINIKGRDDRSFHLEKKVRLRTEELELSNKQKETLLREIHHRVKNNLQITSSLMNLQKRKLQDEEAIYALSSSQDRINAIAMIHQKIYQHDGVDAVDLKGYLENLIRSHMRISPSVKYTVDCPEVFIDLDTAVPLALITSEIVINALKHAFKKDDAANQLYILVTPMPGDVIDIVISDNGSGIPKGKNIGQTSGLGYDIVKKLCRQLEASYEYSSSKSGTAFSLRFKQRKLEIPVFA